VNNAFFSPSRQPHSPTEAAASNFDPSERSKMQSVFQKEVNV
jgi:uncharacterized tellurite resistance protein B-like protein